MPESDCFISVVAPLFDDGEIIESYVDDVTAVLQRHYAHYELVLVDDGSCDDTVSIVANLLRTRPCTRLIQLSRPFGQEIAISAGLDSVIGDFVVVMLPDTDPPELIPEMVGLARGGAGLVFGIRRNRHGEPLLLRLGTTLFYAYSNRILKLRIPRDATHFRLLGRKAVNAVTQIKDRSRYLRTLSTYVGFSNKSVTYDLIERRKKPRRKSVLEAVKLAMGIILANSTQPLRAVSLLGLAASLLNLLYMGYIVAVYLYKEDVAEGWATQSLQIATMFFFLFLMLTVLSEYVGRLLDEVKNRPLYYVADERCSTLDVADVDRKNVVTDSESPTSGNR